MRLRDLDTPAVVIDLAVVERNIARVQAHLSGLGLAVRPHVKTHRLARFAHAQIAAGAVGICCQKLGEAEVMADAGVRDIFIPYNIVGASKLARLVALARRATMSVSADSEAVAHGLSGAFAGEPPLAVQVECDTGAGRCGVQTPAAAAALAMTIAAAPGLSFAGLMTYPPMGRAEEANAWLAEARRLIVGAGLDCARVSTGGTPNLPDMGKFTVATEHRPGTYVYNDRSLLAKGRCTVADCALVVLATIVSRPTPERVILDAGSKALTSDLLGLDGYGHIVGQPDARIAALSEEHGHVHLKDATWRPEVGDRVAIIPNHACVVSNLFDQVYLRRSETEIEAAPVDARGRSA